MLTSNVQVQLVWLIVFSNSLMIPKNYDFQVKQIIGNRIEIDGYQNENVPKLVIWVLGSISSPYDSIQQMVSLFNVFLIIWWEFVTNKVHVSNFMSYIQYKHGVVDESYQRRIFFSVCLLYYCFRVFWFRGVSLYLFQACIQTGGCWSLIFVYQWKRRSELWYHQNSAVLIIAW